MIRLEPEEGESRSMAVRQFCSLFSEANEIESRITEPFEDEIHPRLRFPHRGLVAMANRGTKHSNDSQFFITLGEPPHSTFTLSSISMLIVYLYRSGG